MSFGFQGLFALVEYKLLMFLSSVYLFEIRVIIAFLDLIYFMYVHVLMVA